MAVAIRQTVDPAFLLTQYEAAGWSTGELSVRKPIQLEADGSLPPHIQLDGFEWQDANLFGLANLGDAIDQMQALIQAGGSDLYAYATFSKVDFDALGVKITSYRLVLLHSQVQLLTAAVAILAAAFAAVIFFQYVTLGYSPAVQDLGKLWGSAVTSVGQAVGDAGSGVANAYIWATVASGAILIVLSRVGKDAGVRTPKPSSPHGSVSVKAGPATVRAGS